MLNSDTTGGLPDQPVAPGRIRRRLMTLRSIRWRLPLTYALIALVAALALGTVLITVLRDYYGQRETDYLERHAVGVSLRAAQMLEAGVPVEAMQAQFAGVAFLTQAHVRIVDPDGAVIVDSGTPDTQQAFVSYVRSDEIRPPVVSEIPGQMTDYSSFIFIDRTGNTLRISRPTEESQPGEGFAAPGARVAIEIQSPVAEETVLEGLPPDTILFQSTEEVRPAFAMQAGPAPWAMALNSGDVLEARSDQRVQVPIVGAQGLPLGTVEMFDGLAYGSAIVDRVTSGWLLASAVAVALAASVGWFISRSLSAPLIALTEVTADMARGDLSARARMRRDDEIGRLSQSFDEMADRVEDTVNTLRRFVGDAAHELHTPLTALYANLELAARESDAARRQSFMDRAREQVDRLKSLTTDLLDLSRFESNRYADEQTGVDLAALVREMGEVYASRAEQKGLTFSHELPDGEVLVKANEGQLRRLVANLLDNAIKFTPEDGTVAIALTCDGARVELRVRDTGIGIPQEDLPLLFNRFHRGRNTAAFPGSGLGLAIIKTIVEAHHGHVTVESGARGTCFAVLLPATR